MNRRAGGWGRSGDGKGRKGVTGGQKGVDGSEITGQVVCASRKKKAWMTRSWLEL